MPNAPWAILLVEDNPDPDLERGTNASNALHGPGKTEGRTQESIGECGEIH
jgi:hypothetical protein